MTSVVKKINVFKQEVSFNPLAYKRHLQEFLPEFDDLLVNIIVDSISDYYISKERFGDSRGEKLKTLSLATTGLLYVQGKNLNQIDNPNSDRIIISPKILEGLHENYPRYTNIYIERFLDLNYKIKEEDLNDVQKLAKMVKVILRKESIMRKSLHLNLPVDKINQYSSNIKTFQLQYGSSVDPAVAKIVSKKIKKITHGDINTNSTVEFFKTLQETGTTAIFFAMINESPDIIIRELNRYINRMSYVSMNLDNQLTRLISQTRMNIARNIIAKEVENPEKILSLLKNSLTDIKKHVSKELFENIKAMINIRTSAFTANCEKHKPIIEKMYEILRNRYRFTQEDIDYVVNQISEISDFAEGIYSCKFCKVEIACEHHVKLLISGNKEVLNDYIGEVRGKWAYCKYCKQLIIKNDITDLLNPQSFERIRNNRAAALNSKTDSSEISDAVYKSIYPVLGLYQFAYEFAARDLVKAIHSAIFPDIFRLMTDNQETSENIDKIRIYTFVYAAFYIMDLYMNDFNIKVKDLKSRNPLDYAKFIITKALQKFPKTMDSSAVQSLVKLAHHNLKSQKKEKIGYITEDVMTSIILSKPIMRWYHNMCQIKKKDITKFESLRMLLNTKDFNEVDYYFQLKAPMVKIPYLDALTNYTFADSPSNYLNKQPYARSLYMKHKFNPEVEEMLFAHQKKMDEKRKILNSLVPMKSLNLTGYSVLYGPQYSYDLEGEIIKWDYKFEEKTGKIILRKTGRLSNREKYSASIDLFWKNKSIKDLKSEKKYLDEIVAKRNEKLNYSRKKMQKRNAKKAKKIDTNESYQYVFQESKLGVVKKISSKFGIYMLRRLGQTENETEMDFKNPNFEEKEFIKNDIRIVRVNKYATQLIRFVRLLRENPYLKQFEQILEEAQVDSEKISELVDKNIFEEDYFQKYKQRFSKWKPKDVYLWIISCIADALEKLVQIKKVGIPIAKAYLSEIFRLDQFNYYVSLDKTIETDDGDNDDDT